MLQFILEIMFSHTRLAVEVLLLACLTIITIIDIDLVEDCHINGITLVLTNINNLGQK
jgi:hypothetical protein